jgi:hypothetical protein
MTKKKNEKKYNLKTANKKKKDNYGKSKKG